MPVNVFCAIRRRKVTKFLYLQYQYGGVVVLSPASKLIQTFEDSLNNCVGSSASVLDRQLLQAFDSEFLALTAGSFGQTIGVGDDQIAWLKLNLRLLIIQI